MPKSPQEITIISLQTDLWRRAPCPEVGVTSTKSGNVAASLPVSPNAKLGRRGSLRESPSFFSRHLSTLTTGRLEYAPQRPSAFGASIMPSPQAFQDVQPASAVGSFRARLRAPRLEGQRYV